MIYRYIQQIMQKFKEKKKTGLFFLTSRLATITTAYNCAEPHSQLYDNRISKILKYLNLSVVLRVIECAVCHQQAKQPITVVTALEKAGRA